MKLKELAKVLSYTQSITVYDWAEKQRSGCATLSVRYEFENSADLFISCVMKPMKGWIVSAVVPLDDCLIINCNM